MFIKLLAEFIGIPVTNTSVNPARSTGPALIARDWALAQLWLFWLAPLAGALLAGWLYRAILQREVAAPAVTGQRDAA
jgi:aquaporin Z